MSLQIDIDPHGMNRVPFQEVRTRLLALDRRFSEATLRQLPYQELILAATANAGKAACTLDDVIAEKQRRRFRFLHMNPEELAQAKTYLQIEGMHPDICTELQMQGAPTWHALTPRARLWFKLNCLHTHIDSPGARLQEAMALVAEAECHSQLRQENAKRMAAVIDRITWFYPDAMDDDTMRASLGSLAEEVLGYLDDTDKAHCQVELVPDYFCTSNCYHAIGVVE